jgi:hypothetical protein
VEREELIPVGVHKMLNPGKKGPVFRAVKIVHGLDPVDIVTNIV